MNNIYLEAAFIILLILANGLFAMAEIAVISSRKSRLQQRQEAGDAGAATALELASSPNRFLSTVQIGITLVGIFAGAYGGATISGELTTLLERVPWLTPYSRILSIGLVVLAITYLSLVLGELVPKRLALANPETTAARLSRPMKTLSRIATPAVHLLSLSTEAVIKLIGLKPSDEPPVTEEEVRLLIGQGAQAGVFDEAEQAMLENIFRLGDRKVGSLMVPRTEVDWIDVNCPDEEIWREIEKSSHSVFPVCEDELDNVIGLVSLRDILPWQREAKMSDLRKIVRPPVFVYENTTVIRALETLREVGSAVALVIDEYGGMQGIVSTQDVLQAIVGDIASKEERQEPSAVQRSDGSWLVDGSLPVSEFKYIFDISGPLFGEESEGYHTLGGFVMASLGKIPSAGDSFQWENFRLEVVDMDGYRVDKVLLMRDETIS